MNLSYSVIIPTYNRVNLLQRAIDSVLAQTYASEEIIIVDDGSTDKTESFIADLRANLIADTAQSYPKIVYLKQSNQGVSAARNAGFNHATGQWIALLDSDDEWLPNKIEYQLAELMHTELLVCHSEEIWIRNGVRVNAKNKHKKKRNDIFYDCLKLCAMSPSSIVLHRDIWIEFNGFDEDFIVCEDYDLWLRICARYPVALIDEPQVRKYGGHDDQLSRQYFGMDKFRILAMQKLLEQQKLSSDQEKQVNHMLKKKLSILLKGAVKHQNEELLKFCEERLSLFSVETAGT